MGMKSHVVLLEESHGCCVITTQDLEQELSVDRFLFVRVATAHVVAVLIHSFFAAPCRHQLEEVEGCDLSPKCFSDGDGPRRRTTTSPKPHLPDVEVLWSALDSQR